MPFSHLQEKKQSTVDGPRIPGNDIIKLKAVGEYREMHCRVKMTTKLGKLKKSYCKRVVSEWFQNFRWCCVCAFACSPAKLPWITRFINCLRVRSASRWFVCDSHSKACSSATWTRQRNWTWLTVMWLKSIKNNWKSKSHRLDSCSTACASRWGLWTSTRKWHFINFVVHLDACRRGVPEIKSDRSEL